MIAFIWYIIIYIMGFFTTTVLLFDSWEEMEEFLEDYGEKLSIFAPRIVRIVVFISMFIVWPGTLYLIIRSAYQEYKSRKSIKIVVKKITALVSKLEKDPQPSDVEHLKKLRDLLQTLKNQTL